MPERQTVTVERQVGMDGHSLRYFVRPGRRHGTWIRFEPEEIPQEAAFAGDECRLEIERIPKAPPRGQKWRVVGPA